MAQRPYTDKKPKQRFPSYSLWPVAAFNLFLAALQLLLFAPLIAEGRALEVSLWPGAPFGPLYRVDALALVFGVAWTLALALVMLANDVVRRSIRCGVYLCLFSLGLLNMAYAREPLILYAGWELAWLGLWLALRELSYNATPQASNNQSVFRIPYSVFRIPHFALHIAGLPLLLLILFGYVGPFAPPQGGGAQAWPLPVAVVFGALVFIRAGHRPFDSWPRAVMRGLGSHAAALVGIYMLSAPFLLAKALVAAPWDGWGGWALALLGTIGLCCSFFAVEWRTPRNLTLAMASVCAAVGVIGLGLAPASPLAAAGAVAVLLACTLWLALPVDLAHRGMLLLLGGFLGVWLASQGALEGRYGLVGALLLPGLVLIAAFSTLEQRARQRHAPTGEDDESIPQLRAQAQAPSTGRTAVRPYRRFVAFVPVALLTLAAIYPQAVVEWVVRPVVGAMAGGVGVPSALVRDWGVGLVVRSPQESMLAAFPATGIAVAVFLAWVALYWLKQIASYFGCRSSIDSQ